MSRFETCAFFSIVTKGVPKQRQQAIENMCEPYCKEKCPVKPDLEFTGDDVVPYQEVVFHGKA